MQYYFLPNLKQDNKITAPAKTGLWKNNSKAIIRGISDAIETSVDELSNPQGVSSIPDIWARPLMFYNFLFSVYKKQDPKLGENKEPLNAIEKRTFQEWKGLLSLLALKETNLTHDKIEIVPFYLKEDDKFCDALKTLSPKPIFLEPNTSYEWTDILIIRYEGLPVGAFSPATLVYSAIDYNIKKAKEFRSTGKAGVIFDDLGFLCPPKKHEDLLKIGEWLSNFKKKIDKVLNTTDKVRETDKLVSTMITVLIDIWLTEIKEELNINIDQIDSKEVQISENIPYFIDKTTPEFLNKYFIYRTLLYPLESDKEHSAKYKSDIELKTNRKKYKFNGNPVNHVLLISKNLYSNDYRIWEQMLFSYLGNDFSKIIESYFKENIGQDIGKKDTSLIENKTIWIRPEEFFLTDSLLISKNDKEFLVESENKLNVNQKYVLPFKAEILEFYSPEEIVEVLKPAYEIKKDHIIFSFNLPIEGSNNCLLVKKTYKRKNVEKGEGAILESEVPVIEIFPNYLRENWKRYYILQSLSDKLIAKPVNSEVKFDLIQRIYNLKLSDNREEKVKLYEIKGNNAFPEGIQLFSENEAIGLILLERIAKDEAKNSDCVEIGIDFGTSNTNIYFRENDAEGSRWTYDFPDLIRQITSSKTEYREEVLNSTFIPTKLHNLPIFTALLNRHQTKETPSLLLDYFIYFAKNNKDYTIPQNVHTNLKWRQDVENYDKDDFDNTEGFIQCLLFLVFIKIARKQYRTIILNCTYPKAFSSDDIIQIKTYWNTAIDDLLKSDNKIIDNVDIRGPYILTEGKAAGYFFSNTDKFTTTKNIKDIKPATLGDGAVCIDVGGGTTDVSIWFDSAKKAFYDTSVLLAGKEISDYIRIKGDCYDLFSNEGKNTLKLKANSTTAFSAILNMVLKTEEKDVYVNLSKFIKGKNIQLLRRMILLEFGALAYYTAILCRASAAKSDGKEFLDKIKDRGIDLYWGGNGSKFISWIDYGQFNTNSNCVNFLNLIFYNSLKLHNIEPNNNISQYASPEAKSESCAGIIVSEMDERELTTKDEKISVPGYKQKENGWDLTNELINEHTSKNFKKDSFVNGEVIETTDNRIIESYDFVTHEDLFKDNKTTVKKVALKELELFIRLLNLAGVNLGIIKEENQIILDDNIKPRIQSSIIDVLKRMQDKSPEKRRIEPIFILEIKELMKLL